MVRHSLVSSFILGALALALAGCPPRNDGTDTGMTGADVPRIDAPVECTAGPETSAAACADGCDNDGNTFIDCDDFDCTRNPNVTVCPQDEYTFEDCTDGIDNDGNNHTDCDDFGCQDNRAACDYQPQD